MQCCIIYAEEKKKAECRVNPSLNKPHSLVISEHMRTLHVLAVVNKLPKRANVIRSQ